MPQPIFYHIPKTAGTSVWKGLALRGIQVRHLHFRSIDARQRFSKDFANAFKFTFVRNPWEHAVSWYYYFGHRRYGHNTFEDWVLAGCPNHFQRERCNERNGYFDGLDQMEYVGDADFIGRYENLQTDVNKLAKLLEPGRNIGGVPLGNAQQSGRPQSYHDLYTEAMIQAIAEKRAAFIERFGYSFWGTAES